MDGVAFALVSAVGVLLTLARRADRNLYIPDKAEFDRKRKALVAGGKDQFVLICDFDRTLTSAFTPGGDRCMSCHGMVESCPTLSASYRELTRKLFEKYYPLEISSKLSRDEKLPYMREWYKRNHDALMDENMKHLDLKCAVEGANTTLRKGVPELFRLARIHSIPFLVFSAGIGDVLQLFLKRELEEDATSDNVHVVSNSMMFNYEHKVVGFSDPLIHMLNKNASHIRGTSFESELHGRNVLLAGDSVGDATMADNGPPTGTVLKIGFLNENVPSRLAKYAAAFDAVVLRDAPATLLLDVVKEVLAARV